MCGPPRVAPRHLASAMRLSMPLRALTHRERGTTSLGLGSWSMGRDQGRDQMGRLPYMRPRYACLARREPSNGTTPSDRRPAASASASSLFLLCGHLLIQRHVVLLRRVLLLHRAFWRRLGRRLLRLRLAIELLLGSRTSAVRVRVRVSCYRTPPGSTHVDARSVSRATPHGRAVHTRSGGAADRLMLGCWARARWAQAAGRGLTSLESAATLVAGFFGGGFAFFGCLTKSSSSLLACGNTARRTSRQRGAVAR